MVQPTATTTTNKQVFKSYFLIEIIQDSVTSSKESFEVVHVLQGHKGGGGGGGSKGTRIDTYIHM